MIKNMENKDEISVELRSAVNAIKAAILQSQYRAAKGVNREQLSLYFGIGRYISEHSRDGYWGTGAIERISEQLQKELPGIKCITRGAFLLGTQSCPSFSIPRDVPQFGQAGYSF